MCYIYDGEEFKVPIIDKANLKITSAAKAARVMGLENWQINLKLDEEGVSLLKLRELNLF